MIDEQNMDSVQEKPPSDVLLGVMLTARSVKLNGGFHKMVYLDTSGMINNLIEQTLMRNKPKQ